MTREQCYGRLKRGAIMFLALTGKDIIHVSWVGTNESSHNEFYFSPVDFKHEASIGGTMTYPKYRGKNINALVYSRIFLYLKNKSYKRAVFDVNRDNKIVPIVQAKLGSEIWGTRYRLRVLLLTFKWYKYK